MRTTIHSDLISKEDLTAMVHYLEQKGYQSKYYIQYFANEAPFLEKLGYSYRKLDSESLSTASIQIVIRN
ncbi:hypothetical protein [Flavobacterium sp.]|uniref:hypothetical protein n=1 Tax=Flavobacterium sp. TaxID=239 RepID=UPI002609391A|nr:hypothetical protein [Flavobacterium sp.]